MSLERHFSRICTSLRIPWATCFPAKIPAKLFLSGGRSGKRSNSSKAMSEKRFSVPYRRAFHGQDTFFAGSIDQDPHGKSIFFLSGSSCIPEDAFLSGDFGRETCWDPTCAILSHEHFITNACLTLQASLSA